MTFREKFEKQYSSIGWCGCPHDHGYEERRGFYTHCASMSCEECWNREIEEKENGNMKYKVGDTVLMQAEIVTIDETDKELPIEVSHPYGNKEWVHADEIFSLPKADKTYKDGLQDAWELARKLYEMKLEKLQEVFGGFETELEVMQYLTPQEALAKLKEYEEATEIKVGDVVEHMEETDGFVGVVIDQYADDRYYILTENGCVEDWCRAEIGKTDKHIDIAGLLEQIKGE